ncbi:hypothetical protein GWI33_010408 [Rhynchophorus ferrugineus]|uniref:Uncharacterized protein n=1 Tax=Rhynchophorus ferrugineus TaxID=354439 RepID=A0A834IV43_RHYFE|nr:hypothetical protein GWI33_010408 [Rhynchophorus ferrugineus]
MRFASIFRIFLFITSNFLSPIPHASVVPRRIDTICLGTIVFALIFEILKEHERNGGGRPRRSRRRTRGGRVRTGGVDLAYLGTRVGNYVSEFDTGNGENSYSFDILIIFEMAIFGGGGQAGGDGGSGRVR